MPSAAAVDEGAEVLVEVAVADRHDLDRDADALLDRGGGGLDRGDQAAACEVLRLAEQPGAQLALLAARQAHRLGLVAGALDQRQGLQHRVVQVRGHLGALLGADPLAPLVASWRVQAQHQRAEQQDEPAAEDDGGHHEVLEVHERVAAREDRDDPADDQRAARAGRAARPPVRAPGQLGAVLRAGDAAREARPAGPLAT